MKAQQDPGFLHSLICFGGVIITVIVGLLWLGISLHSLLLIALVWVAIHSVVLGFDLCRNQIGDDLRHRKGSGCDVYLFSNWVYSSPHTLRGARLEALSFTVSRYCIPPSFLPAAVWCCVASCQWRRVTAWGTIGTIGVVLMGLGEALGIPLPLVAGMVVSGATFGRQDVASIRHHPPWQP